MPLANYIRQKVGDHIFRNQAFTPPTTVYIALFTTMPALDGTGGVEVSGGSYARVAVTFGATASDGSFNNSAVVTFAQATANWGTIVGWGAFDASSGGNLMMFNKLEQTVTGEVVTLASGLVSLANADISSVTVKNNTDVTTYTENTDYYIQYDQGVVVRIPSGSITVSQQLHVTYNYPLSFAINSGMQAQFNANQLALAWKAYT